MKHRLVAMCAFACAVLVTLPAWAEKPQLERPNLPIVGTTQDLRIEPVFDDEARSSGVWQHSLQVPDAAYLKPRFERFNLRRGDILTVRSASGKVVEELTGRGPKDRGSFWGLSAFGNELHLELRFDQPYGTLPFVVSKVIVGDPAMLESATSDDQPPAFKSVCSPSDFEDVLCYDSDPGKWANIIASVGVTNVGQGGNNLWCSGSNVSPNNFLLTNQHCIEDQSGCDNAEFVFKYYRQGCNDGSPPNTDWVSFRCDQIQAISPFNNLCDPNLSNLDFTLASVIGDPASEFGYVTPDPTPLTDGEAIYIVQHPSGRPHEIAHGDGANVDVDGTTLRYYDTLDTEGGSSGSPIYRESDDKLVGLHHCGGCSSAGVGNRGMLMSDIYPQIAPFLCTDGINLVAATASEPSEVSGNGDTVIDPGETWSFVPTVRNGSCSTDATDVEADLAINASSVAIQLLDTTSTFGNINAGESATGTAVRFEVDAAIGCAGDVIVDLVDITAGAGGPFDDALAYFSAEIGDVPQTTMMFENWAAGIPGSWTIVDGGTGSGTASTWTTLDPGARGLLDPPFAIVDSDNLGSGEQMDEELISPAVDVTGFSTVNLQLDHNFRWYNSGSDEQADIDVRSSATGGNWVNVANFSGADASGNVVFDLTAWAAADLQVRFHYYDATYEWWWAIDDVYLVGNDGRVCSGGASLFSDDFETGDLTMWTLTSP